MLFRLLACLIGSVCLSTVSWAQFLEGDPQGTPLGKSVTQKWRFGVVVSARDGPLRDVVANTAVPRDWLGQRVRRLEEDVSHGAKITYRTIDHSLEEMRVTIPRVADGEEVHALVTYEIRRSWLLPPKETAIYVRPNVRKLPAAMRVSLKPSPFIESTHSKIRTVSKRIGSDTDNAWDWVGSVYDWVKENVRHEREVVELKGALASLKDGTGDCDELTCLFIAICRANNIPARTVRVPGHCFPEFYLEDKTGKGHWFPCEPSDERRIFGGIPEHRPILQKGDNVKVRNPQTKRIERHRFPPQSLIYFPASFSGKPMLKLVCELVEE